MIDPLPPLHHNGERFWQAHGEVIFTVCRDSILLCGAPVGINDKALIHCFEAIFGLRLTWVKTQWPGMACR